MNRFRLCLVVTTAAVALFGAQAALGTTVQKLSLQELTKKSDSIVMARVDDAIASWDAGHKEIYTYVTLSVIQPVKGSRDATTIMLRQLGGTVDNIASVVPGMPSFKKGEEVVVFLTQKDPAGYPWVMGLEQGKYSISTGKNGVKMVRNDLSGTEMLSKSGQHVDGTTAPEMPLSAFLDGLKTTLDIDGRIKVDPNPPTE